MRNPFSLTTLVALTLLCLVWKSARTFAAPILIDSFNSTQGLSINNYGYNSGVSYSAYDLSTDAVGGSRQAYNRITNAVGVFDYVNAQVSGGVLAFSSSPPRKGYLGVIYDNLGSGLVLDMTSNFAADDSFIFDFSLVPSSAVTLTVSLHSGSSGGTVKTVTIPASASTFSMPLSSLVSNGSFSPSNVSRIQTVLSVTADGGTYRLNEVTVAPEPSALFFLLVSCSAQFGIRRFRTKDILRT